MSRPSMSSKPPVAGGSSAKAKVLVQVDQWRRSFMDCLDHNRLDEDYGIITQQIVSHKVVPSKPDPTDCGFPLPAYFEQGPD
jgi:hypothetical protein